MPDLPDPLGRRFAQVTPAETSSLRGLLTIAVAGVVVAGIYFGRSMLLPITLTVPLALLLAPLVSRRWRWALQLRHHRVGGVPLHRQDHRRADGLRPDLEHLEHLELTSAYPSSVPTTETKDTISPG